MQQRKIQCSQLVRDHKEGKGFKVTVIFVLFGVTCRDTVGGDIHLSPAAEADQVREC